MFTGLVEEVGTLKSVKRGGGSCVLTVECSRVLEGSRVGDSIAVNGVCLTVTSMGGAYFTADAMPETLDRSSLGKLPAGSPVNLERAMPADGRFGGHIVSGHIDGMGTVMSITPDENAVWYRIGAEPKLLRYIVEKGSITVDGISLTVADTDSESFSVSIIPHTQKETSLRSLRSGSAVNLETDIIGKYVEKLMQPEPEIKQGGLTEEFLRENGFL
ncbi:MAG: riboflavin synthase [Firmicutes bacterium]|nr:riboflavin synthase [Bacillota bacterium]